ncbi:hypothetical protein OHW74_16620 [Acinetobacter baumannii]|nr:hypothetical protein [Acinetobacter baumannii]
MKSENIGIEINGGSENEITRSQITINGLGKGIVINNSSHNKVEEVLICINAEKTFNDLKSILIMLNDKTTNNLTKNTFRDDSLSLVDSILQNKNHPEVSTKLLNLTSLLSNWITISTALTPIISPYIDTISKIMSN